MGADRNINLPQDSLDKWLERALRQYGDVEPRQGLEHRVMANLESAPQHVRIGRGWVWALGTGVFAAVCVAMAFWLASATHPTRGIVAVKPAPHRAGLQAPRKAQSSAAVAHVVKHRARRHIAPPRSEIANEPRLETFPSLRPLSEQERLLQQYVSRFPDQAKLAAREQAETEKQMEQLYAENAQARNLQQER